MKTIVSCIPTQLSNEKDKLQWLNQAILDHPCDIFVTPQEFFGGAVIMPHKKHYTKEELFPKIKKIVKRHKTALVLGVSEKTKKGCFENIWFINQTGELIGSVSKFALPKYDHVATNGFGELQPALDFNNRFVTFDLDGLIVSAMFCWEVYSDLLWTGLGLLKPDVVFSLIKFGINSWPKVKKNKTTGQNEVVGFGYGGWAEAGQWQERLRVASLWQVKCPIICATNTWNLRPISQPMCGTICPLPGQGKEDLWVPTKDMGLKNIPETFVTTQLDEQAVRASTINKFVYKEMVGDFPPFQLSNYTMMLKINRVEGRILSGAEQSHVERKIVKSKIGNLGI